MKEIREDDTLHPQRIRIEIGGVVMARGSLSNIAVVMRSLLDPEAIVFMHATAVESFEQYSIDDEKRRLN